MKIRQLSAFINSIKMMLSISKDPNILRFINDVIKPFEELNEFLLKRYAFSPELNDVTRIAYNLAYAINHFPEYLNFNENELLELKQKHNCIGIIGDMADSGKHGNSLRDKQRNNDVFIMSSFEFNDDNKFSFINNEIIIQHHSKGENNFMALALDCINYWIEKLNFKLENKNLTLLENKTDFLEEAWLKYDSKYCIHMEQTKLRFYKKDHEGKLILADPPTFKFAVY